MKIANKIALSNKGAALVTGDAVGQVASQTLSNIEQYQKVLPILSHYQNE